MFHVPQLGIVSNSVLRYIEHADQVVGIRNVCLFRLWNVLSVPDCMASYSVCWQSILLTAGYWKGLEQEPAACQALYWLASIVILRIHHVGRLACSLNLYQVQKHS